MTDATRNVRRGPCDPPTPASAYHGPVESSALLLTGIGLASAAGLNAYIPLLIAGLLAHFEVFTLAPPYDVLASTPALVILAVLLAVEVLADKIPAVDSINDVVQTLMRPASGAVLFAAAFGADSTWTQAAALIAGMVTAGHRPRREGRGPTRRQRQHRRRRGPCRQHG